MIKDKRKFGTWNICGLTNKEPEIAEFMTQGKISMLGITDTRKKGTGTKEIDANYVLIWSGVCKEKRAVHGVGFIIQHDTQLFVYRQSGLFSCCRARLTQGPSDNSQPVCREKAFFVLTFSQLFTAENSDRVDIYSMI